MPLRSDMICRHDSRSIEIICVAIVNKFMVSRILLSKRRRLDAVLPRLELQVFKKFRLDKKSIRWWSTVGNAVFVSHPPPTSGFIYRNHR